MPDAAEALRFLEWLCSGYESGQGHLSLWTRKARRTRWFGLGELQQAAAYAVKQAERDDVYVRPGLQKTPIKGRKRGGADTTIALPGVWADIDFGDSSADNGKAYPPAEKDAFSLIEACGLPPSVIVHTGHGLHAWWFWKEPQVPPDGGLLAWWGETLMCHARNRGWMIDSTFDLARVMRLPGTQNWKDPDPLPVRQILPEPGAQPTFYLPENLQDYLCEERPPERLSERIEIGSLVLSENSSPPAHKLQVALANDLIFQETWARRRRDLKDNSQSAYDMSLAHQGVGLGWTDQEIAELLVAHRRVHAREGLARKLSHKTYYRDVLAKARAADRSAAYGGELTAVSSPGTPASQREILNTLSGTLGVRIKRLVRYVGETADYYVEIEGGGLSRIGPSEALMSQRLFRARLFDASGVLVHGFKTAKWESILQAIASVIEEEEIGPETTAAGVAAEWLSAYLRKVKPADLSDDSYISQLTPKMAEMGPYIREGVVYIVSSAIRRFIQVTLGENVSRKQVAMYLRAAGCKHSSLRVSFRGDSKSKWVWEIPTNYIPKGCLNTKVGDETITIMDPLEQ